MKQFTEITHNGQLLNIERRIPKIGEHWLYIGFDEPLELVMNNLPESWFENLWDIDNYYTVIQN